jgi:hypothetical protein
MDPGSAKQIIRKSSFTSILSIVCPGASRYLDFFAGLLISIPGGCRQSLLYTTTLDKMNNQPKPHKIYAFMLT